MSRLSRFAPLLFGIALAVPAVTTAQAPPCKDCQVGHTGYAPAPAHVPAHGQVAPAGPASFRGPKLCQDCYNKYKATGVWPGPHNPNLPGWAPQAAAPGYAMTGQQGGGTMMAQQGGYAPGYAVSGEEPSPIGVMRTNFRPGAAAPNAAMPSAGPSTAPGMMPMASPAAFAGPRTKSRQGTILKAMLGLNGYSLWRAEQEAKEKAGHARETFGYNPYANEVPAGMVRGR